MPAGWFVAALADPVSLCSHYKGEFAIYALSLNTSYDRTEPWTSDA